MDAKRRDGQMLKGLLDLLVLRVLSNEANYGFGILQQVEAAVGGEESFLREATLYPLLHRLDAKGFLQSFYQPGERGTPRKYYRITAEGRTHLRDRIEEWRQVANVLNKLLQSDAQGEKR